MSDYMNNFLSRLRFAGIGTLIIFYIVGLIGIFV